MSVPICHFREHHVANVPEGKKIIKQCEFCRSVSFIAHGSAKLREESDDKGTWAVNNVLRVSTYRKKRFLAYTTP